MSQIISHDIQAVVFTLNAIEYCVDISNVQEIIRLPQVTPIPGTEKYILGIINLRGTVLPIVDLQQKLFFVPMEFTEDTRVIVIDVANRHVGLIVDEVLEVKGIPASEVITADSIGTGINNDYILGVARFDKRLLILLNADRITT